MLKEIKYKVKRPGVVGRYKRLINTTTKPIISHEDSFEAELVAYDCGWHSVKTTMEPPAYMGPSKSTKYVEPSKYLEISRYEDEILKKAYELGRLHRLLKEEKLGDRQERIARAQAPKAGRPIARSKKELIERINRLVEATRKVSDE